MDSRTYPSAKTPFERDFENPPPMGDRVFASFSNRRAIYDMIFASISYSTDVVIQN